MVDVAVDILVADLRSSPAVCDLLHQQHDAVLHNSFPLPVGGDQCDSPQLSADVFERTAQTLFQECQQMTCMSSDTTLAIQSLSDKSPVLLQVHRCALASNWNPAHRVPLPDWVL